jgi:hypothetical protein
MLYPSQEIETALKKLFAAAWLRMPDNPFAAAREVDPENPGKQYYISQHWINDPVVIAEKEKLVAHYGPVARVPSKEELALEVYRRECKDDAQKLQYLKFFAQLMGYTEEAEGGRPININNMVGVRIMPVPLAASDDEWEKRAREHAITLQSRHG